MQSSENQKTEKYLNDVNHYLFEIKQSINTFQLDYNRDKQIQLFCNKLLEIIEMIEKLVNSKVLQLPIEITTKVNHLFKEDENLSIVVVKITNPKRPFNPTAIGYLNL